jgi:hypothetical protein
MLTESLRVCSTIELEEAANLSCLGSEEVVVAVEIDKVTKTKIKVIRELEVVVEETINNQLMDSLCKISLSQRINMGSLL